MFLKNLKVRGFKVVCAKNSVGIFPARAAGFRSRLSWGPNPVPAVKYRRCDTVDDRRAIGEAFARQKVKAMIFAGTGTKARLGSASVSLFSTMRIKNPD